MRWFSLTLALAFGLFCSQLLAAPGVEPEPGAFFFSLTIGTVEAGMVRSVSGLGSENEIVEYRTTSPTGQENVVKLPGRLKYLDVVVDRGVSASLDLATWRREVEEGHVSTARRDCSITMIDQTGVPVAKWTLTNAWPAKISYQTEDSLALEVLTLAIERLQRVAP